MKTNFLTWCAVICLCFLLETVSAQAYSFLIYEEYGGTWSDVNKIDEDETDDDDDGNLCWAAVASNLLAYTGWGLVGDTDSADAIFDRYKKYWSNDGGNMLYGIDWWFNGTSREENRAYIENDYSYIDYNNPGVYGGGGFWLTEEMADYYLFYSDTMWYGTEYDSYVTETLGDGIFDSLYYIDSLLNDGYGVGLSLSVSGASGHAVTVWGYDYNDDGTYTGIYLTDSDDKVETLQYYEIFWNDDYWYLYDFNETNAYYITEVQGLAIIEGTYATPEPSSGLLVAMGLLCFCGGRSRFQNRKILR